ncbi:sporulation protein [Staphylococcus canis]|uniref:Sporulation protein n=1 Tax=Staphylococcus canis TaxID=2724942 RepID=A0ABS0T9K3_9STAP|nr:sporulation protein [Staphylococcus canis]MBI5975431.1 sporulation protein [Staphylococcus canis]
MGFENIITSLGINGMKVFIRLDQKSYHVTDEITGSVILKAGQSSQEVTHIALRVIEKYENDDETSEFSHLENDLDQFLIEDTFTIEVDEEKTIPFKFKPENLNFKSKESHVYLNTHVYIDLGIDEETEAVIPYHR